MPYRVLLSIALLGLCSGVAGEDCDGCPVQQDPKSPRVLGWADEVIAQVQANIALPNCLFREEVYNATSEVVVGFLYRLTFRAGHSKCKPPNCAHKIKEADCQRAASIPGLNIKGAISAKPNGEPQIEFEILK